MQVSRWVNSIAIRLPAYVVKALKLQEGEKIEVIVADDRVFQVKRKPNADDILSRLRKFRGKLPADFKFDRKDAHAKS